MIYPIKVEKQKLTRDINSYKTPRALKITPIRATNALCLPTYGYFSASNQWKNIAKIEDVEEAGRSLASTLWIGKNNVPDFNLGHGVGTLQEEPSEVIHALRSLVFENGRTDNYLDTFFSACKIYISKSIKFPEEMNWNLINNIELGTSPLEALSKKHIWNIYLPASITTINFNTLNKSWCGFQDENKDHQVHIYLEKHTTLPEIIPLYSDPNLLQLDESTNIYFYVNEDIYDEFYSTYSGNFEDIIKLEKMIPSWITVAESKHKQIDSQMVQIREMLEDVEITDGEIMSDEDIDDLFQLS